MTRAHYYSKAADSQGNVVPGTQVTIYEPNSLGLLVDTLYANAIGSVTLTNPFTVNDGIINFYLNAPRQVKVGLRAPNGAERFYDNQDVYPDPASFVRTPIGLVITNSPQPGDFLQSTSERSATWVSEPQLETAAVSPVTVLRQQEFSAQTLGDLTLRTMTGAVVSPAGYPTVTGETLPPGYAFTRALDFGSAQPVRLTVPSELYGQPGWVQFAYKVISDTGAAGRLRVDIDGDRYWMETPTTPALDIWQLGYLPAVPAGDHVVRFTHYPGEGVSRVLLGGFLLQYGGQVLPHAHEGLGLLTTALGPGAQANFAGATAIGADALAAGADATVLGAAATAGEGGVALGAGTEAMTDATALGYGARTSPSAVEGIAVGSAASSQAPGATALGVRARAQGLNSVAIGPDARAALGDAIAIGHLAEATGNGSIALGEAAVAGHERSVAIGPGARTTADDQVVLGTADGTTVFPGELRQSGDTSLGAEDSLLGFYGATPIGKPVVSGSRGGNATLTSLLTLLETMGLIDDQSTA